MWIVLVALGVIAVILFVLRGSPELARLEVRDGKLSFVSGRLPGRLFAEFGDVLSRRSLERADIRIVLDGGSPRVVATGIGEDELQQLRNVTGSYTSAQFRSGRAPNRAR